MSYPRNTGPSTKEKVGYSILRGFFVAAFAVLAGVICFIYYEAIRTLLTWGWSDFNIGVLSFTLFWGIVSLFIYYGNKNGS